MGGGRNRLAGSYRSWPVVIEMDAVMDSPVGEGTIEMRMVMDGFQWDVQVDPDEFVPEIPEDYSELANIKIPKMDAAGALNGFELYAGLTGRYPEKLTMGSLMKDVTGGMTDLETKAGEIAKEVLEDNKDLPTQEVIERKRSHSFE